ADAGWTLGHTRRLTVYPKATTPAGLTLDSLLQHPDSAAFSQEIPADPALLQHLRPYAWSETSQGLGIHANAHKIGVSLGVGSRQIVHLPEDFDGVFLFQYQDGGTAKAAAIRPAITQPLGGSPER
ncbi:MAG: hypothetical protein PHU14_12020, partial [Methylovulum sp.]|nr:hypothetical protein [Methylovulum sp.]